MNVMSRIFKQFLRIIRNDGLDMITGDMKVKKANRLKGPLNALTSKKRLFGKLMDAIENNNVDAVNNIINKGVDVNYSETPGRTWTSLMFASQEGRLEAIKCLIAAGANINAQNDSEAIDTFEGEPKEIMSGRGRTALMEAVLQGNLETVEYLLANGADPNPKNRFGDTALHIAADFSGERDENTSEMIAQMLIDYGAHFDSCNDLEKTALNMAAWSENSKVVFVLLRAGADPNLQDGNGNTALMGAAYQSDEHMVDMLLAHGAKPNVKRNDGKTALTFAEDKSCEVVAMRLRKEIYSDSRVLEDGKEASINKITKLIGLQDINSLKKIGKSIVPELVKGLNDTERSNRRFVRDALRTIDTETFLQVSQESCLTLGIKLYEDMFKPIDLHIILAKERDEIVWAILANIAALPDFDFFAIEIAGEVGASKTDIQALFGDGVVHVLEGVEGRELIHKQLENIASNYSDRKRCRHLLIGPLSSDIFTLADMSEACASIYYVGLNNCDTIIETFPGCDSCKQYQIASVVTTDDQLMDNHDAESLRRYIDDRVANLAEPIIRNYYKRA